MICKNNIALQSSLYFLTLTVQPQSMESKLEVELVGHYVFLFFGLNLGFTQGFYIGNHVY